MTTEKDSSKLLAEGLLQHYEPDLKKIQQQLSKLR